MLFISSRQLSHYRQAAETAQTELAAEKVVSSGLQQEVCHFFIYARLLIKRSCIMVFPGVYRMNVNQTLFFSLQLRESQQRTSEKDQQIIEFKVREDLNSLPH